ncbi:MAG: hypothetical protein ACE149_19665 [Armatimonadota bacterium]
MSPQTDEGTPSPRASEGLIALNPAPQLWSKWLLPTAEERQPTVEAGGPDCCYLMCEICCWVAC